jgi:hypothetical protein
MYRRYPPKPVQRYRKAHRALFALLRRIDHAILSVSGVALHRGRSTDGTDVLLGLKGGLDNVAGDGRRCYRPLL